MKSSNKRTIFILFSILLLSVLSGCGNSNKDNSSAFDMENEIHVLTREDGSGTRGAFAPAVWDLRRIPNTRFG